MKLKFVLLSCLILNATIASAALKINVDRKPQAAESIPKTSEPLTQQQYDQQIEQYIAQVNETKKILDVPEPEINEGMQKKALCQRIQAYQKIYELSEQNIHLDQATSMKYVAQVFLDRQKTSLEASGMMESNFCK